jgi:type IV pilus assembly protein PilQ
MSTRLIKITILVAAMFPISGAIALAQDTGTPPPAPKPEAAPVQAPASSENKSVVAKGKDTLSVDFPDEEIRNVLRNVADLFELNLVIPETLQGKTSIKLRDVTWRQIYQVVLQPVGYTFVEDGNIIKVVTQESLNLEPLTTEVFVLNYAKASEIKPSLDSLVDAKVGGKIVVDTRSNALVVTERGSVMQKLKPIVLSLDRPNEQVMIESKFIEVTNADVKNIGVNWSSLNNYKIGAGPIRRTYTQSGGRTTSTGTTEENINPAVWQNGADRASQITGTGFQPKRVVTTTTVPVGYPGSTLVPGQPILNPTTGAQIGTTPATALITDTSYPDLKWGSTVSDLFTNDVSRITSAVFSADQFSVILSALQTQNNTKLVSNPTVVTLNNTEASINMGDEIPIPNFTYNQEKGVFEISGFTFKPVGILLKVTPQVNTAGFIKLAVEPEVSSTDPTKDKVFGVAVLPVITTRKAKTQVTMKDGFTLGIGGMIQKADSKGQTKVPVLGDIPGLGRLFRSDTKNLQSTNLVIFLTAKTIKPDGGDVSEVFDPRLTRQMEIEKADLPGYRDGSNPFYTPPPPEAKKKGWFGKE